MEENNFLYIFLWPLLALDDEHFSAKFAVIYGHTLRLFTNGNRLT
jgi:hypothetical protein